MGLTTEQKAKAYDEALKRAKAAIDIAADKDLVGGVVRTIFPELRESESEDERIRKALVKQFGGCIKDDEFCHTGFTYAEITAWLEKQKGNQYFAGYFKGYSEGQLKSKQEEIPMPNSTELIEMWDKEEAMLREKDFRGDTWRIVYNAFMNGFARGTCVKFEKQKSISQEDFDTAKHEALWEEQKPNSTKDMPYIADEHFYERAPADSFKYKLAEYMTKGCTKKEGPYGYTYAISAETILKMAEEELLKRGVVQKPAEWSEKDEDRIRQIERIAQQAGCTQKLQEEIHDWLNSLRPQPKVELSEDVKKTLDEVSHILVGLNYKQIAKDYKQAVEKLIYARPSWKPSEEQMDEMEFVINDYREDGCNRVADCLQEILEQMKKL